VATPRPTRVAPSATPRPSRAAERRARQVGEARAQRRIYLIAGAVGILVAATVIAGLLLTVVLPPRAAVVTVGSKTLRASDLAERAKFAAVAESGVAASNPATVIPTLIREETLRQRAGELGVSVSDEDLTREVRRRVGSPEDQSETDFRAAYDRFMERLPISRDTFEEIVRVSLLRTKVVDAFKAQAGEKGPQLHLLAVGTQDRAKLDEMKAAVASGKDFKEEAVARGLVKEAGQTDLQWFDPQSLPARVAVAKDLQARQTSDVFMDDQTGGYILVQVAERSEDRPYDDAVKAQIANRLFDGWIKAQEEALAGEPSFTGSAKSWVGRQVKDAVAEASRRAQQQASR